MKERIWELDAFRGACVLGMVLVHFVFDLTDMFGVFGGYPQWFSFVMEWGGVLFLLLSGICVTLGSHPLRRGLIVFGCGMVCTAVTAGMYLLGAAGKAIIIYFGVLHCLGSCMLLWPVFRRIPTAVIAVSGVLLTAVGFWVRTLRVQHPWLIPFGVCYPGFASSDYFPLLPFLGFFLLGAAVGQTVYRRRQSLLPKWDPDSPILRFLCGCGRHSLWIYLLHQPVLYLICFLIL